MWLTLLSLGAWAYDPTHADLAAFLAGAVNGRTVDYRVLATRRPLLDQWLAGITGPLALPPDEALALWIDAYNALSIQLVLDAPPAAHSLRDLDAGRIWSSRTFVVGGERLTLDALEQRVRASGDPRVHAALVCASAGCPPLSATPMRGAQLHAQLDAAAQTWAREGAALRRPDGGLAFSEIFRWYAADFAPYAVDLPGVDPAIEGAVGFLVRHGPPALSQQALRPDTALGWEPYDWAFNGPRPLPSGVPQP
jgi:hypothetical protein